MTVSAENRLRWRAILISREVKWLFKAVPGRWREHLTAPFWRWAFLAEDGQLHRVGEIMLADLRDFCTGTPMFSPDPLVMARRAGRREVFERITNYLNLDEAQVQKIMELDDGLE